MTVKTFTAEVEVGLDEFDDDEIEAEYELRRLGGGDQDEAIEEMFYAFKLGKDERALHLARQIAQDATGKVLP